MDGRDRAGESGRPRPEGASEAGGYSIQQQPHVDRIGGSRRRTLADGDAPARRPGTLGDGEKTVPRRRGTLGDGAAPGGKLPRTTAAGAGLRVTEEMSPQAPANDGRLSHRPPAGTPVGRVQTTSVSSRAPAAPTAAAQGALHLPLPAHVPTEPAEDDSIDPLQLPPDPVETALQGDARDRADPLSLPLPVDGTQDTVPMPQSKGRDAAAIDLAAFDEMVSRGAWNEVQAAAEHCDVLDHRVHLLKALADRELEADDDATQDARIAIAGLMGVPSESAIALMIAKRLLRRPPPTRPQPSAVLSLVVTAVGFLGFAGAGWLVSRMMF